VRYASASSLAIAAADAPAAEAVSYLDFIRAKAVRAPEVGLSIDVGEIHPALKPHCRDIVAWAIAGGRRAIFASFGLHKTIMQLELQRLVRASAGGLQLQIAPLNVILEATFAEDAARLGGETCFVQSDAAIDAAIARGFVGQYITNYESVREGKIDPRRFHPAQAIRLVERDRVAGVIVRHRRDDQGRIIIEEGKAVRETLRGRVEVRWVREIVGR
jgi:hypothetical protein